MPTTTTTNLLPEVESFLAEGPHKGFIGGQWVESSTGETLETHDPGSGEKLTDIFAMQGDDVDRAVDAAADAFRQTSWGNPLHQNERSVMLHRLADAVEKHKPIISQIESLDCGKILSQAEGEVQNFSDTMRYFADLAMHVQQRTAMPAKGHEAFSVRLPWGPCAFILPWNFPFLLLGWNIAPALAAGNTVIVKPAEDTSLSTLYLGRLAQEVGIPDGVINVVPGYGEVAGAALASSTKIKRMAVTGSPEIGREIAAKCGRNLVPIKLELGGKGAAVVFDDVDLDDTADKLVRAITTHAGQVCCDATRWLIQDSFFDKFVGACLDRFKNVNIGYQMDDATDLGPLVNAKQEKRVLSYLERGVAGGAELVLEGGATRVAGRDGGYYVKPALLAGSLDNVCAQEEIFGPVAYLAAFKTEEQAIAMTNQTDYGLGNSVWTPDLGKAHRVAEQMIAGSSWINTHNTQVPGVAFGGVNKSGMGGGVGSLDTLLDYWRALSVIRSL